LPDEVTLRLDKDFDIHVWWELYRACGWYRTTTPDQLEVMLEHAYAVVLPGVTI